MENFKQEKTNQANLHVINLVKIFLKKYIQDLSSNFARNIITYEIMEILLPKFGRWYQSKQEE